MRACSLTPRLRLYDVRLGDARVDLREQLDGADLFAGLDAHLDDLPRRLGLHVHREDGLNRAGGGRRHDDVAPLHGDLLIEGSRFGLFAGGEGAGQRQCQQNSLHGQRSILSSRSILPSRRWIWRRACAAMSCSWVTRRIVWPWSCSSSNSRMISSPVAESRFPVGSSASRMLGSFTSARAIATPCRCPPDSSFGLCVMRSASPTRSSARAACWRRACAGMPA